MMRSWRDKIPLHYEYTAGLAGEKFLRGIQEGRILASRCPKCGTRYLPPKAYCVKCFDRITTYRDVGPTGKIAALAESFVNFDGTRRKVPELMAFITFGESHGGLIHRVVGKKGVKVGSKVSPKFRPKSKRTGSLSDIEGFRLVSE
jgi:hypothetical protein